jgi:hypothetical protein
MVQFIKVFLVTITVSSFVSFPLSQPSFAAEKPSARFFCGQSRIGEAEQNTPTTFARTKRGNVPVIRWKSTYFENSNDYSPMRRCEEVSLRFQEYYSDGTLDYLTSGQMNSQNVICVADEYGGSCQRLLFTLEPKDNPQDVLRDLLSTRDRSSGPLTRGAGALYVDMANFLETAPVEENLSP